jgi:sirohydrochlorin ferrochelatase
VTLVLAAHGTREPAGAEVVHALADGVRRRLPGVPVEVAFADVLSPTVTEVVRKVGGPAVVVPAFLAAGYHVRVDIPEQVAAAGCPGVVVADPLGSTMAMVTAVHDRLLEAGWRREDDLVLAAAGSSDPHALADVRRAAILLGARTGARVRVGYVATAAPTVADAVASDASPGRRVAIASWLLAPGLFHRAAADSGADLVSAPIGAHPKVVDLVVRRYREARCYLTHAA